VRVECDGPLRPINPPMSLKDAPVTVVPARPDIQRNGEPQP
jgi:hypothetical protein